MSNAELVLDQSESEAETHDQNVEQSQALTQDAVQQMIASAVADALKKQRDSVFAEARRTVLKGKPTVETRESPKKQSQPDPFAVIDAVDDASERYGLNTKQKRALRSALTNSENINEEIERYAAIAGWSDEKPQESENKPSEQVEMTQRKPANPGAPSSIPEHERPTNPFSWSRETLDRIVAEKGKRAAGAFIRRRAEEYMTGRPVSIRRSSR
jgi:hypothetical protein